MIDFASKEERKKIISEIKSSENQERKKQSFIQYDIFKDNQHKYVVEYLRSQFSESTVKEMPVISSINLAKRIITQESSVYKNAPSRKFMGVSETQESALVDLYEQSQVNSRLLKANRLLKLHGQAMLYVVPGGGRITVKNILPYQVDVIPNDSNPEIADAYIISAFDRRELDFQIAQHSVSYGTEIYPTYPSYELRSDGVNNLIADQDDYRAKQERYVVWTNELNFVMDGNGDILSESVENPLGVMPFVDIYHDKTMEFWVRTGQAITDFSVQFNASLSDLANIVRMQGWGQAWLKGPKDLLPESIVVGVNKILKLPIDVNNNIQTDFGFSTPNPDLRGSIDFIETMLAMFMSSRGIDPKSVTGKADSSKTYSSGIERLLSLVEKFEATKEDYSLFKRVESSLFEIIKKYINLYAGSDVLSYWEGGTLPEDSFVSVEYSKPEMIQTDSEKVDLIQKKLELGLISQVEAIMIDRGVDKETARMILDEIEEESAVSKGIRTKDETNIES